MPCPHPIKKWFLSFAMLGTPSLIKTLLSIPFKSFKIKEKKTIKRSSYLHSTAFPICDGTHRHTHKQTDIATYRLRTPPLPPSPLE